MDGTGFEHIGWFRLDFGPSLGFFFFLELKPRCLRPTGSPEILLYLAPKISTLEIDLFRDKGSIK